MAKAPKTLLSELINNSQGKVRIIDRRKPAESTKPPEPTQAPQR